MKHLLFGLCALGVAGGVSAATVTTNANVVTVAVPMGETYTYGWAVASPVVDVVKTGTGTAKFTVASAGYAGAFHIDEGVADFAILNAYGTGPITVANGAQMKISHASAGQVTMQVPGTVTIAGAGPDGKGAIYFSGSGMGDQMFNKVVLSADASMGVSRCGSKYFDCQGHKLTWVGGNMMVFNTTFKNFSELVHAGTADICFQSALTTDAADAGKPITINSGYISFWGPSKAIPFGVVANCNTSLRANSGSGTIAGPVTVQDGKTLDLIANGADRTVRVAGVLGGAGKVTATGAGKVYLDNAANTWTGGFRQSGGTVYPKAPGSLPGYDQPDKVALAGGTLVLSQPTGWTPDAMTALHENLAWSGGSVLDLDIGSATAAFDWTWKPDPAIYQFDGSGALSLAGFGCERARFRVNGPRVTSKDSEFAGRTLRELTVYSGSVTLDGPGCLFTTNAAPKIGGSGAGTARLVLTNGASLYGMSNRGVSLTTVESQAYDTLEVGGTGTGPAVVEIYEGSAFTGKVYAAANGRSAWYLRGGEFCQFSGPTADGYISRGANGYGYIGQTGGRFLARAHTGIMAQGSVGIYHLKGGEFSYIPGMTGTGNVTLSRGYGTGILYQTGGVHNTPGHSLYMGIQSYSDATGGLAIATLNGPNALMKVNMVDLGLRLTNFTSHVNLMNGGVLQTKYIEHATTTARVGSEGYVNFNGGVYKAAASNGDIFGSGVKNVKKATVFANGAVFDNSDYDCGVGIPYLTAPTGKGVSKIEIPSSVATTGYYGSPEVVITGDGFGASAFCEFDDRTGKIGPVVVTCPGWDYTTATATIRTADRSKTVALTLTLADNVSGGVVKLGKNMLTLKGVNTFTGESVVSNGTLRLLDAGCIPAGNDIHMAGGALDLNGKTHTLGRMGGFGTVKNGTVELAGLRYGAAELLDNVGQKKSLDLTAATWSLPAGASVTVTEPDLLPKTGRSYPLATAATAFPQDLVLEGLPAPWTLVRTDEGRTLKLVYAAGATIIVR